MTTTRQISDVLSSNLLQVAKAECYHKTSRETNIITDSFLKNFQFLCESRRYRKNIENCGGIKVWRQILIMLMM